MDDPLKAIVEAIERELDVSECVLTDPLTLRRLKAERIARAALAAMRRVPPPPRWLHVKRGTIYTEIGRGFAQVSSQTIGEGTAVAIYRGEDGRLWVRNAAEFDDGRFVLVDPAPGEK